MPSKPDSVTLYDVAHFAGVSHQTVSRVINKAAHVAAPTRLKVLKAISHLGYRPNPVARNLVTQRSGLIGVITFCQDSFGPSHLLISLDTVAMQRGYNTLLASVTEPSVDAIRRAAGDLRAHGVEGVVLNVPTAVDLRSLQEVFRGMPYVVTDAAADHDLTMVTLDHELGAQLGTEHLIEMGHRQIACISGPLDWRCGLLRRDAWRESLQNADLNPGPCVVGEWSAKGGLRAAEELIKRHKRKFTAIVAGNDQMALGAMRSLSNHGLRVPDDVAIVGFDDMPEAAFFTPSLTTVTHDFQTAGRACLEFLLHRIRNPDGEVQQLVIKSELIVRESTGRSISSGPKRPAPSITTRIDRSQLAISRSR